MSTAQPPPAQGVRAWVTQVAWIVLARFPLNLLLGTCGGFLFASIGYRLLETRWEPGALSTAARVIPLLCSLLAGWLWGLHRTARQLLQLGLGFAQGQARHWLDVVVGPLLDRPEYKMTLDEARSVVERAAGELRDSTENTAQVRGWRARLGGWVWRRTRCMIARLAHETLDGLQERGNTEVSLDSLRRLLQDRILDGLAVAARRYLRPMNVALAILMFLLLVLPWISLWWLGPAGSSA